MPAVYSNFAMVSHTPTEVLLVFAQILPDAPRAKVLSRIVLTPTHAKLVLRMLSDNLDKYEAQFGEIQVPKRPPSLAQQLFSSAMRPNSDEAEEDEDKAEE